MSIKHLVELVVDEIRVGERRLRVAEQRVLHGGRVAAVASGSTSAAECQQLGIVQL